VNIFVAGLLHWVAPLLTAATATVFILLARALPSHPAGDRSNASSQPSLLEIFLSAKERRTADSVVQDGGIR
jgi:hypothetical protein